MPLEERKVSLPTPENVYGRAQIVIQFIDNEEVFWLNESSADVVKRMTDENWDLTPKQLQRLILNTLIKENTISLTELETKLDELKIMAKRNLNSNYFVQIRCPNDLPYQTVINVVSQLADNEFRNIKYGCVGGSIDEIKNCRRLVTVRDKGRLNLQIDF